MQLHLTALKSDFSMLFLSFSRTLVSMRNHQFCWGTISQFGPLSGRGATLVSNGKERPYNTCNKVTGDKDLLRLGLKTQPALLGTKSSYIGYAFKNPSSDSQSPLANITLLEICNRKKNHGKLKFIASIPWYPCSMGKGQMVLKTVLPRFFHMQFEFSMEHAGLK